VDNAVAQAIGVEVMLDDLFAAPAMGATGEIGLAVSLGIEQLGDLLGFELLDVGDAVLIRRDLVDEIAL
jgi:hypothetical protein